MDKDIRYLRRTLGSSIERAVIKNRAKKVSRLLFNRCGGIVQHGPFKGMALDPDVHWGKSDLASKILGFYELEVLGPLLAHPDRRTLVDLGCADGYYAIGGVFADQFDSAICFDRSAKARSVTRETASLNRVSEKIVVYGEAGEDILETVDRTNRNRSDMVMLSDIEGGEFEVFSDPVVLGLKETVVIIELHGFLVDDGLRKEEELIERFSRTHNVAVVETGVRDTSSFRELDLLDDNDRWLVCSEGRKFVGRWIHATPL